MQEFFVAVTRRIEHWELAKERGSFRGWLQRVTRNLVINWMMHGPRCMIARSTMATQHSLPVAQNILDLDLRIFTTAVRRNIDGVECVESIVWKRWQRRPVHHLAATSLTTIGALLQ